MTNRKKGEVKRIHSKRKKLAATRKIQARAEQALSNSEGN